MLSRIFLNSKFTLVFSFLFLYGATALSQEAVTPKEVIEASKERALGWSRSANLGANVSFSSSEDVVGQTDGTSETYGTSLKSNFNYMTEDSEWRNSITLLENITKTPSLPRFVKSTDELKLESIYLYSIPAYPRIGPYVKGEAFAPIFKGEDVQTTPQSYVFQAPDGTVVSGPVTTDTVRLTDGFKPLTTKESIGFFWKAKEEENLKILARVGFGGVQINASGQYAIAGKDDAGNIIVKRLEDVNQAGLELGLSIKGKVDEKTAYEFGAESLTPFINNKSDQDDRDALRLTNIDSFVKLTSNITSWASFGYDYRMRLQPQLVDRAQNIHMIVLNINYNLF